MTPLFLHAMHGLAAGAGTSCDRAARRPESPRSAARQRSKFSVPIHRSWAIELPATGPRPRRSATPGDGTSERAVLPTTAVPSKGPASLGELNREPSSAGAGEGHGSLLVMAATRRAIRTQTVFICLVADVADVLLEAFETASLRFGGTLQSISLAKRLGMQSVLDENVRHLSPRLVRPSAPNS